jgi:hypothetical protein
MSEPSRIARAGRLLAVLTTLSTVWLGLLPHWARQPRMQAALQTHTDRQINGSATYYTENPAALSALHDLQQLQLGQPGLFWGR